MAAWPTVTDDTGDKVSGTIFNKSLTDAIKAYIDGYVISATNPTIEPNEITDEVVTARGSKSSLDARLDVALNEDGTPKAVAGQATETQVGRQANGQNFVRNPYMDYWSDGDAVAPDYYALAGAGAAVQRCGDGMADTTKVGAGRWSCRVISGAGADANLSQDVIASTEMDDFLETFKGRKVNLRANVYASGPNLVGIYVNDGVTTSSISWNSAGGSIQMLSVQHTIANTATMLQVVVRTALGTNTAYMGGVDISFGDVLPTVFTPRPVLVDFRSPTPITVARQLANVSSAANPPGPDVGWTWSMPANTLSEYGHELLVEGEGTLANNANAKNIDIYVGTSFTTILTHAAGVANNVFTFRVRLIRTASTTVRINGVVTFAAATGAAPTVWHIRAALGGGAIDLTTAQSVTVLLRGVNASDVVLSQARIEFRP